MGIFVQQRRNQLPVQSFLASEGSHPKAEGDRKQKANGSQDKDSASEAAFVHGCLFADRSPNPPQTGKDKTNLDRIRTRVRVLERQYGHFHGAMWKMTYLHRRTGSNFANEGVSGAFLPFFGEEKAGRRQTRSLV